MRIPRGQRGDCTRCGTQVSARKTALSDRRVVRPLNRWVCMKSVVNAGAIVFVLSLLLPLALEAAAQRSAKKAPPALLTMQVTAYCVEGETASGEQTRHGIVAADPAVLPLGSVIRVSGLRGRHNRTYTVEDTGRKVKGRAIDIFMHDCRAARRFGRQTARVRVLERGDAAP